MADEIRSSEELAGLERNHIVMLRTYQRKLAQALHKLDDAALEELTARDLTTSLKMMGEQLVMLDKLDLERRTLGGGSPSAQAGPAGHDDPLHSLRLVKGTG